MYLKKLWINWFLKNHYEYKYLERRIRHIFEDRKSQYQYNMIDLVLEENFPIEKII